MKSLPELMTFIEGLIEPHILFDTQCRILAANAAYRRQFSPHHSVVGRTCYEVSHRFSVPCDQAGESCPLVRSRESGQRERVLHLLHTPKGEEYVNIELAPLLDATGQQAFYVEKMEALRVTQDHASAQGLIGRSRAFLHMLGLVARVAPSQAAVLLLGDSGTGKELVAHAVHEASHRAANALVPVDCASLPENLFEPELFSHERGTFTGANSARGGLVEAALRRRHAGSQPCGASIAFWPARPQQHDAGHRRCSPTGRITGIPEISGQGSASKHGGSTYRQSR